MSETTWTRLAAPFPHDAVAWDPFDVGEAGDEVLLLPRLARRPLTERLDEVLGVAGWSVGFEAVTGGVACTVRVGDVTKAAVADDRRLGRRSAEATAEVAFARASELFGMHAPVTDGRWAPFDGVSGMVLDDDADVGALPAGVAEVTAEAPAADVLRDAAEARGLTGEGQRMIDRLVERLKDEGQGLAAARLLVKYGGYGGDPAAARELYAELRALLISASERVDSSS